MTAELPPRAVPASTCPCCDKTLDAVASPFDAAAQPGPGDVTVCLHCAALLQFGADLRLAPADLDALAPDDVIMLHRMQQAVRALNADRAARAQAGAPPVTEIYAFLADNDDGESIVAARAGDVWLPLITTKKAQIDKLRATAQALATAAGKPVRLARFTARTDLELIPPGERQP